MNLKTIFRLFVALLAVLLQACTSQNPAYLQVPLPASVKNEDTKPFLLNKQTCIVYPQENQEWFEKSAVVIAKLEKHIGYTFSRVPNEEMPNTNYILFRHNLTLPCEGFKLKINADSVVVEAKDAAGFFYATQWIYHSLLLQEKDRFTLPAIEMQDFPGLSYRGAMLDVSRHFFSVDQVKRVIDLLAMHRLNYFHWHLTDDQGWRIELKKYPALTEVGAWRGKEDARYGGFYTQEDIKEVIDYASQRAITIIPEIDLPGHTTAALAAYPQLGCTGGPYQVALELGGVHKDVICMGQEFSFQFAKDVLTEVVGMFPSPYIHIGGDEVPRDRWKNCRHCQAAIRKYGLKSDAKHSAEDLLQGEFNNQMAAFLKTLGRKMIGWDEVLSDNIDPETVIMSWRGLDRGFKALEKCHPVIFSSNGHFYLNNYQARDMANEPMATGGLVMMQKLYDAQLTKQAMLQEQKALILGAEVCLWTSYVNDNKTLDYMLLPRLAAFSEVAWSGDRRGEYADFLTRLPSMLYLYQKTGYAYAPHFFEIEATYTPDFKNKKLEIALTSLPDAAIYYTLDGSVPTDKSTKYQAPFYVSKSVSLRAVAYLPSGLCSDVLAKDVNVNKATFAGIELLTKPEERYAGKDGTVLVDGVRSAPFHTTGLWVGYESEPLAVTIDLGSEQNVKRICLSSMTDMSSYIMGISSVEVALSVDGTKFKQVAQRTFPAPEARMEGKRQDNLDLNFTETKARYVKIVAYGFSTLPAGHSGAGKTPFLFVDEIELY